MTTDDFALGFVAVLVVVVIIAALVLYASVPTPTKPPADPPEPTSIEEWRVRAEESQHRSDLRRN